MIGVDRDAESTRPLGDGRGADGANVVPLLLETGGCTDAGFVLPHNHRHDVVSPRGGNAMPAEGLAKDDRIPRECSPGVVICLDLRDAVAKAVQS